MSECIAHKVLSLLGLQLHCTRYIDCSYYSDTTDTFAEAGVSSLDCYPPTTRPKKHLLLAKTASGCLSCLSAANRSIANSTNLEHARAN